MEVALSGLENLTKLVINLNLNHSIFYHYNSEVHKLSRLYGTTPCKMYGEPSRDGSLNICQDPQTLATVVFLFPLQGLGVSHSMYIKCAMNARGPEPKIYK